jgi:murein tripeptide amidase MpaA
MTDELDRLHRGFRDHYLRYDELRSQLAAWAEAFPQLCRVQSIGTSEEGRDLLLLIIGPDPDRIRPAVWVDGNMHAVELAGSSVALAIAEDVLRLHLGGELHGLGADAAATIKEVLFYILPRMSPDGAECVLDTGRYVRSMPRDHRPARNHPRWVAGDVDGDGLALQIRIADPTGEFIESRDVPGLMLQRRIEDEGPFYKLYPEGTIENFDGHHVPTPDFLSDNQTDLNRNFPYSWAPEPDQVGAGTYPASEPESRAVVEFTSLHPNVFAWLNLHTFGGVFIRPLGHAADGKMDQSDLALFRQIEQWGEQLTGYPTVSGYDEFLYAPDKPLHGDLTDYAYHQRGCIAYVIELWDLFKQLGIARKKKFVDHYTQVTREEMIALARWDAEHNQGRAMRPWTKVEHPQLGAVEIGGVDARIGLWNPPFEKLGELCRAHAACFLRVAAMAPRPAIGTTRVEPLGDNVFRLTVTVANRGYLPTHVLDSAKKLEIGEPLWADLELDGCRLEDPSQSHREVGHLDGWGRGLYDGTDAVYYQFRGRGSTGSRTLSWIIRGTGNARLKISSCRMGAIESTIPIR